jgi:hypothetical protein
MAAQVLLKKGAALSHLGESSNLKDSKDERDKNKRKPDPV